MPISAAAERERAAGAPGAYLPRSEPTRGGRLFRSLAPVWGLGPAGNSLAQ